MATITQSKRGAVSIFVVVFTALLMTIVTVSFARLMLREQQRAASNDLSQSAYDAALAGVEDAKRALARYEQRTAADPTWDFNDCNTVPALVGATINSPEQGGGVAVGDQALQQAYTCVLIDLQTDDYIGSLSADESRIVPLQGAESFNRVRIEWFSREIDLSGGSEADVPASGAESELPVASEWPRNRPPVLETQLMQTSSSFTLDQFNAEAMNGSESNANTLFLYPKQLASSPTLRFINDARFNAGGEPTSVQCRATVTTVEYACSATIELPQPVSGGSRSNAYLRLASRYNQTQFRVSLYEGTRLVQLDGVQPAVDSTGRASDLFRRVSARIETGAGRAAYPDAAVDITGNFCKTFRVTSRTEDYRPGDCTP